MNATLKPFVLKHRAVIMLLLGNWALGVLATLCFKEGGTDPGHRIMYFIIGNVLGISSTAVLMCIYSKMNVNLAMVIAGSGGFILQQFSLWMLYSTRLSPLQWAGIAVICIGAGMASFASPRESSENNLGSEPKNVHDPQKELVPC